MRLFALLPLLLIPQSALAAILAVDYGSEWIKASLVKPGTPFDVLLNKDSKRKIQASVGWKRDDRVFGQDAFNLAARFPQDSFSYVKYLQGVPYDSEITRFYRQIQTCPLSPTSRKTVSLLPSSGGPFTVEDLIAMQLSYSYADGEKVRDVIVTVPPFYTQFERDAMVDAIEIAGLKTLALINDGTAVAVNYAMTRTFAKPEVHVIYDAGASSIRATVGSAGVEGPQVTVMGVGYDRRTGGIELDRRMREILIESFNAKHGRDVRQDAKGMAKLWKEAGRVKVVLSANSDAIAQVESIAWDLDLKTKVTREMFEKSCDDMKGRFAKPIHDAVANAGLTMNDVSSVILTGGASRTPMIQAAIRGAVGEGKIAQNVNADEAAVLGAALRGASLSAQFRTKNMKVSDMATHDVQASYSAGSTTTSGKPRTITTLVFPAGSRVGTKKTMTFKRRDDFTISLDYKDVAPDFPQRILEAEIVGVAEAIANLTELGVVDPVVKTTVTLSESGFVSVSDAIAYGEIKDDSLTGKLKGLFAASSSEDTTTESVANQPPRESDSDSDAASPSSSSSAEAEPSSSGEATIPTPSPSAEVKKILQKEQTIPLTVNTYFISIQPMSVEEKKESRNRLRALDAEEASKIRREEARNSFEGYLYRLRDLLDPYNTETPFKKCSQESERRAISEKLDDSFTWLFEMGDLAETSQLLDKRVVLEAMERPIIHRYQEIEAFPQALNNSQMWNWSTRLFLQEARQNITAEEEAGQPSKWTKDELEGLEKTLREHEGWLNEWVEKQKKVKSYEDPVIETTEMKARAKVLEQHLQRLVRRRVPKVKKANAKADTKQEHDEL
ncbi:heat shock protein 70 family [Amanita rubescens]|nr:heat shock protein 70 family [Amanita rubescens]